MAAGLRPERVAGGSALGAERVRGARQLPASRGTAVESLVLTRRVFHSFRANESVPSSLHRHHLLPLFDFADCLFAAGEYLLGRPFSAVQADTSRTISNASSGVWTDPRIAFSTRSSDRAN
jgi:hypothetical protein